MKHKHFLFYTIVIIFACSGCLQQNAPEPSTVSEATAAAETDTVPPVVTLKQRYVLTSDLSNCPPESIVSEIEDTDTCTLAFTRFERTGDLYTLETTSLEDLTNGISLPCDQEKLQTLGSETIPTEAGIYRMVLSATDAHGNSRLEEVCLILDPERLLKGDPENIGKELPGPATVKAMLSAAVKPAGACLYVWGGGWNEEDTAAGIEAMTLDVSPRWYEFFCENDSGYQYERTRYQIHDGLDCSGFVGYVTYQIFGDAYSDTGYVYKAGQIPYTYQELFGGEFHESWEVSDYRPCDIMGKNGHVYLVIGECDDGSVLFVHASPPAVSLCGTPTPAGSMSSQAIALAKQYMSAYRSECYNRYDTCYRDGSFLTDYYQFRWDSSVLTDPDGYREMSVEEILADLFQE